MATDPLDQPEASLLTIEQLLRNQRRALAERLFDLEVEVALLQQEVALRDKRVAELETAARADTGLVEPRI